MTPDGFTLVLGTGVTVGTAIAGVAVWAFKAVVAKDVTPTLVKLGTEAHALTREFQAFREAKEEERRELRAVLQDLDKIVRSHETRIVLLESGK